MMHRDMRLLKVMGSIGVLQRGLRDAIILSKSGLTYLVLWYGWRIVGLRGAVAGCRHILVQGGGREQGVGLHMIVTGRHRADRAHRVRSDLGEEVWWGRLVE